MQSKRENEENSRQLCGRSVWQIDSTNEKKYTHTRVSRVKVNVRIMH